MFKKEEERESKRKRGRERGLCEWPLAVFNLIRTTKSVYVNRQQFKIINWIHKNHSRRKMLRWKKKIQDSWPVFDCSFAYFIHFTLLLFIHEIEDLEGSSLSMTDALPFFDEIFQRGLGFDFSLDKKVKLCHFVSPNIHLFFFDLILPGNRL